MAKRSLQASDEGIKKAKLAFNHKGWTQKSLATQIGLDSRQPIWKFFTGQPVARHIFHEICLSLALDPDDIVQKLDFEQDEDLAHQQILKSKNSHVIDPLVAKIRAARAEKIHNQCSNIWLLDVARTVELDELFVEINVIEEITSQRWLNLSDLSQGNNTSLNKFEELSPKKITGLQAIEKFSKLVVFGKPGSGKTTFLKSIAILCNQGKFQHQRVPIFINLTDLAENLSDDDKNPLFSYITQQFSIYQITQQEVEQLLHGGKALILLDGWDEVAFKDSYKLNKCLNIFFDIYYKNMGVITCRNAYNYQRLQGFSEVEIAEFSKSQIIQFANKWFAVFTKNNLHSRKTLASKFIAQITIPENRLIQNLTSTPLFLNLTCLAFQYLADFPTKRSEIYRQGLELLLVRWDEARGIKRDDVYRNLTLVQKIKLLSYIAAIFFEKGDYFFEESQVCQLIADYLCLPSDVTTDLEDLLVNTKVVIKAIELQHGLLVEQARGIYSFSHVTFHEYLTARKFVVNNDAKNLEKLANHVFDKRWREVILLTSEMLSSCENFFQLMKQKIDNLVVADETIKHFLTFVMQKSSKVTSNYHRSAVRAFYFTLVLPSDSSLYRDQTLAVSLDHRIAGKLADDLTLDLALIHTLIVSLNLSSEIFYKRLSAIQLALDFDYLRQNSSSLYESLNILKQELPNSQQDREILKAWWQSNGQSWTTKLKEIIAIHRHINYDWEFSKEQLQLIHQYWKANNLLVSCFSAASHVTPYLREMIEETLLLPPSQ